MGPAGPGTLFDEPKGNPCSRNRILQLRHAPADADSAAPKRSDHPRKVGLAVSRDGRWILYVQEEQSTSDIMLVENLR